MSAPTNVELYRAARQLAADGQPVFPCRTEGDRAKRPFTRNGFKDATVNGDQIKAWWQQHKGAAIGVPTGVLWDVLDVDVKNNEDGRLHLPRLRTLGLLNGCKRVVRTPSGGFHLYFTASPGLKNKANRTLGLDVRSAGGYVLAPTSYIETDAYAGTYDDEGETTGSTDDPLFWEIIRASLEPFDEITKKPVPIPQLAQHQSIGALRHWLSNRQEGERNHALHWAVHRCIEAGIDPHELVEAAVYIGLGEEEILATIGSALRRAGVTSEELHSEAQVMFG